VFAYPDLDLEDAAALDEIVGMRASLSEYLRTPRRWEGRLRRTALARAIRGSNSIEGINVSLDDADAALDDEPPLSADQRTFAEILGYRQALGYVLAMSADESFELDTTALRSMHFMMLSHDLSKSPGRYRSGDIHVQDERTGANVYTGPPGDDVPALVDGLVRDLRDNAGAEPLVAAAMAHLDLVMIHPFRDGNGRMSRALQTLVLSRSGIAEAEFASIEEWLGANTEDYYAVLARTGRGSWQPDNDAHLWVKFNLRAHHLQAQTVAGRFERTERLYEVLDAELRACGVPDRALDTLYSAALRYRIRRPTYVSQTGVDERTASRDLSALVAAGLLGAVGQTKGRHYVRGPRLESLVADLPRGAALTDPYPWLRARLAEPL
jgi:Fic family protein